MRPALLIITFMFIAVLLSPQSARTAPCGEEYVEPQELCRLAVEENDDAAVRRLRALGKEGFDAMLAHYRQSLDYGRDGCLFRSPKDERAIEVFGCVAGQKDAAWSRLFWHTDFNEAMREAAKTGKPILSLRLLGRLDESLSCANSRFFRTALYANRTISNFLREHYILHWQSVRNAPKLTIDFGDGRRIERTITGNSIHYILDARGRVIDAIPGLYGAERFLSLVSRGEDWSASLSDLDDAEFTESLRSLHASAGGALETEWVRAKRSAEKAGRPASDAEENILPAVEANRISRSKCLLEAPVLARFVIVGTEALWQGIAALPEYQCELDAGSQSLIRCQYPAGASVIDPRTERNCAQSDIQVVAQRFRDSLAVDTVRNEFDLHYRIHELFKAADSALDLDALNRRVYDEIFLTSDSDIWLGLVQEETYAALPAGGLVFPDTDGCDDE